MKKKVLITGGAGFIGSYLCELFLGEKFQVFCLDNLLTGRRENIVGFQKNENFEFIEQDISKPVKFTEKVDYILHFASPASPTDYLTYPVETLKAGSMGTLNCLELAKKYGARILVASTSEIYGDPLVSPQAEDYWGNVNPVGPRGVYDEAKRFTEAATMAYHRSFKVNVGIIRIFNTYGPRMRHVDGRAVPNFICQALANEPITVYGTGQQTRSFSFIDDTVAGIHKLMLSGINEPVNIGNDQELSIAGLANEIIRLTKSQSTLIYKPLPVDDPKVRRPDISKAKKALGWEPKINLVDGLTKTIDWFKAQK